MDILLNLAMGFQQVLTPIYLLFVLLGVGFGLIVGALPGLGPTAAIAILLPLTYKSDPVLSMVMLTGIYYGAMFGGSYTSILLNIPGESSAVMTALEGYQLALQGQASKAIQMANMSSFLGGTISVFGLTVAAPLLSKAALAFGPPEYFILMMLGLSAIAFVGTGSPVKALIAGCFGLMLGTIGSEPITGAQRYTFGSYNLGDGIPFAAVAMGIFAIAEVLINIEKGLKPFSGKTEKKMRIQWPTKEELKISMSPAFQGTGIGFVLGALPGVGPTIASFLSYSLAKLQSKRPEKWGKGAIEGIAAVETANNAAVGGAMVPLLSLGIPGSSATAVLLGGLLMHGLRPGPLLFSEHPEIPWGVIASMYIGNIIAIIMGITLSVYFIRLLKLPPAVLNVIIFLVTIIGAYSINNNVFDIWVLLVFGVVGYFFKKVGIPEAPVVLGLVLGPLVETTFGQSLIMSHGSLSIFVQRPVSLVLLIILIIIYLWPLIRFSFNRLKYSNNQ
ncbi:tripartite tricarboxylate transporter permease [Moorella sulfitireducens]|uniref:tripartite tricarboxylate transporter permease n=1 Tax=Neomoorella sulfitireducens TaxID=2972948 RepID=UPI0021ACC741|nr:tripartite tricarboxylate transporter permease [Moorella sulfitireducens]